MFSAGIVALLAAPVGAQNAPDAHWEWTVAPYVLFPTMKGTTELGNMAGYGPVNVDASAGDIFSHLQGGAMMYVQARKGDWAFALDGIYMNLKQDITPPPLFPDGGTIAGSVSMKQGALEGFAFRRIQPQIEIALGVLGNSISGNVDATVYPGNIGPPPPPYPLKGKKSATWAVPGERWHVVVFGDAGTLGSDNWTWQLLPSAGYKFSKLFELSLQYRVMSITYRTGSGADTFDYDMDIFGPEVAFAFHF
jgi:hypothetical protein